MENAENRQPEIKELTEQTVAYVSFKGNFMGKSEIFKDLFTKLGNWAGPKNLITPETIWLSSYKDDPYTTPPDEMTLEICMTISDDTEVEGEIQKQVLPGGKYVVLHAELTGPEDYGPIWEEIVKWASENNLDIDMSRPSYEIYLNNPDEHPEKHHILDVCLSVKEK